MERSNRFNWLAFGGILLVIAGVWALAAQLLGPAFEPIAAALHAIRFVIGPLMLIAIGVLLLSRSRADGSATTLRRSRTDRVIGGVLGGVAARIGADATVVRVVYAVLTVLGGIWFGVLLYLAAFVLMPEETVGYPAAVAPATPARPAPPVPPMPQGVAAPPVPSAEG